MKAVVTYCSAGPVDRELAILVLCLEDKRFARHRGVDVLALARAIWRAAMGNPNGGASTIDMQLVRTITNRRDRTIRRKINEIILAVLARREFGTTKILEAYLRIAYAGHRLTGLDAAALRLFGKQANQCDRREKAIVAASLLSPVPKELSDSWRERVNGRANEALRRSTKPAAILIIKHLNDYL